MQKILIKHKDILYRFVNFEFKDHADGSLYIVFDRISKSTERINFGVDSSPHERIITDAKKKLKISYHATGRVNFDGSMTPPIFCEPIFSITKQQPLVWIRLPCISALTETDSNSNFLTVEIPKLHSEEITFHISILPQGIITPEGTIAIINYEGWFSIAIQIAKLPFPIPEDLKNHVTKTCCPIGQYTNQSVSKDVALIKVHQKRSKFTNSIITSWEPKEGIYRIIFQVPMRIPPELYIKFEDPSIEAVITKKTCSEVKFMARGKGGYIKFAPLPIVNIELNAEL